MNISVVKSCLGIAERGVKVAMTEWKEGNTRSDLPNNMNMVFGLILNCSYNGFFLSISLSLR